MKPNYSTNRRPSRSSHASNVPRLLLPDGRVLIATGPKGLELYDLTSAELYDPSTGTFAATGSMTTPSHAFSNKTTSLADGRVLMVGAPYIAEVYDPGTGSRPNIVYAGTQNEGVFKSTDYGETWASVGSGLSGSITYLTLDPTKSGSLFASTETAFYLSEDGGVSWTNVLNMPAWTITIDPNMPSTVYATARTQGVFRSLDGGHTWQEINTGLTTLTMGRNAPVVIDPTNPRTFYVGSEGGGVFKSRDGGDHWLAVNSGLNDLAVFGLAMDASNPAVLYACGPKGVYKTLTEANRARLLSD